MRKFQEPTAEEQRQFREEIEAVLKLGQRGRLKILRAKRAGIDVEVFLNDAIQAKRAGLNIERLLDKAIRTA